jgi:hypothetical protein
MKRRLGAALSVMVMGSGIPACGPDGRPGADVAPDTQEDELWGAALIRVVVSTLGPDGAPGRVVGWLVKYGPSEFFPTPEGGVFYESVLDIAPEVAAEIPPAMMESAIALEAEGATVALEAEAAAFGLLEGGEALAGGAELLEAGATLVEAAGGVVLVAVALTLAIDCAQNHGDCIWWAFQRAGGWSFIKQQYGWAANRSLAPDPRWVTVSCGDPTPLFQQCRGSSLGQLVTRYYTWFGGAYWTCRDIFSSRYSDPSEFEGWFEWCQQQVDDCVGRTQTVCRAAGRPHP